MMAFTTEKMAVLAPTPRVRAATAASVNAGLCRKARNAWFRSLSRVSMAAPQVYLDAERAIPAHQTRPMNNTCKAILGMSGVAS
jgi:hypothetical protein